MGNEQGEGAPCSLRDDVCGIIHNVILALNTLTTSYVTSKLLDGIKYFPPLNTVFVSHRFLLTP